MASLLAAGFVASLSPAGPAGAFTLTQVLQSAAVLGVAAYVDSQTFLKPKDPAPVDPTGGARISSVGFNGPIHWAMGPQYRIAGNLIWEGPEITVEDRQNSGDKGGQSASFVTYRYKRDAAWMIQDTPESPIERVLRVKFNQKDVYDIYNDIDETDGASSPNKLVITVQSTYKIDPSNPSTSTTIYTDLATITSPDYTAGGIDLSQFRSGQEVLIEEVVSGTSLSQFTGIHTITASGTVPGTNETFIRYVQRAVRIGGSPAPDTDTNLGGGGVLRLYQPALGFSGKQFEDIEIHLGTSSQLPSPIMEAVEGAGEVPAYRGKAIVVFKAIDLQDSGNVTPNAEFIVEGDASTFPVASAIDRVMKRWGVPESSYDVSDVSENLQGYITSGPTSAESVLSDLMVVYDILHRDEDGVLRFYNREDSPSFAIDANDLAARPFGGQADYPHKVTTKVPDSDLVSTMYLTHIDQNIDYQEGTVTYRRQGAESEVVGTVRFPLVINRTKAIRTAARLVHQARVQNREVQVDLPPSYLVDLRENTNATYSAMGTTWSVLTNSIQRSPGYVLRAKCYEDETTLPEWRHTADANP